MKWRLRDDGYSCRLTQYIILREFAETHGMREINHRDYPELDISNFSLRDLNLSPDDFSRKQGWME